jgi:hypothetical protein
VAVTAVSQPKIVSQEDGRPSDVVLTAFTKKKTILNYSFSKKKRKSGLISLHPSTYLSVKQRAIILYLLSKPSD